MSGVDWSARVVLVTGGAKGVGRAIVEEFARAGARVVINCFHSFDKGKELRDQLRAEGLDVSCHRASVAKSGQRQAMFDWIRTEYGQLDVLVNNSALGVFRSVADTRDDDLRRSFEVNVEGALGCAQQAHELLAASRGSIVNLSSVGSGLTVGNYLSVGASKAAVESLTRYLAAEWAQDGIRVNCVSGGLIAGDVADAFPDAESMQSVVADATPLGRLGRATELATIVRFLASEDASWVTGQTIVADGGLSLGGAMLSAAGPWQARVTAARKIEVGTPTGAESLSAPEPAPVSAAPVSVAAAGAVERVGDAIAIVGMGLVVPGASSPDEFWEVLRTGPQLLRDDNPERIRAPLFYSSDRTAQDKTYQIASGYADGFTPNPALRDELGADRRTTDYPTQWFRHALAGALQGVTPAGRVGCAIGYTADGNQHLEEALVVEAFLGDLRAAADGGAGLPAGWQEIARRALLDRYPLYGRSGKAPLPFDVGNDAVRGLLPAEPEVSMIDTACSSSLYALDIAVKGLLDGTHDTAVCGGTFAVGPRNAVLFAKLNGLSPSGDLRPLDRDCDGVLFSDGAAAVVLKRHADALRDGDPILGFVGAVGMSSDGRGKAIYAPNVRGQKLAIERALRRAPDGTRLDWIVAHATGTPAGDLCEITSIRESAPAADSTLVTSNKSLIGHTGWAAGVVSLIQVLLSLRNGTILPQHRFDVSPESHGLAGTPFRVPRTPTPWRPGPEPRRAAVSGFGFGGTNAHLIVQDRPVVFEPTRDDRDGDVVIVAWAADVPGLADRTEVTAWLRGSGGPQRSFGALYDPASLGVKMPPRVLRTLDRSQLMAIRCAKELRDEIGAGNWDTHRERIGVFVGHMGPTRNAVMYARRCHVDSVFDALAPVRDAIGLDEDIERAIRSSIAAGIVAANEDSFPGIMPNIISARISNVLDTNGPNMGIDLGPASAFGAIDTAARYLRAGDIDIAIAGGINGNATTVLEQIVRATIRPDAELHEGAFLFAAMRRETAARLGMPVLATVGALSHSVPSSTDPGTSPTFFGGAESGRLLLATILTGGGSAEIGLPTGRGRPDVRLRIITGPPSTELPATASAGQPSIPGRPSEIRPPSETSQRSGTRPPSETRPPLVADPSPAGEGAAANGDGGQVGRYDRVWIPAEPPAGSPGPAALPAGSLVLTANPELTAELPADICGRVLTVRPGRGPGCRLVTEVTDDAPVTRDDGSGYEHVRVIVDLSTLDRALEPDSSDWAAASALHDLMFLAAKRQPETGGSFGICLLGSWDNGAPHPLTGLYLGFAKSLGLEFERHTVRAVATDSHQVTVALAQLELENAARQGLPTAAYRGGHRYREGAVPTTRAQRLVDPGGPGAAGLDPDGVVVATAGGKGITAEITKAIARRYRCAIYLIGSTNIEAGRRRIAELGGPEPLADRSAFIRAARRAEPERRVADVNREFDTLLGTREILDNIAAMERHSGVGRITYLTADVTSAEQLASAVARIEAAHPRVDLVIHGAGVNRAATVRTKTLEQFRTVRAVKIGGYLNLRRTFSTPPRMWCSFSSLIGLTGQRGETDYASANDALVSLAGHGRATDGRDEFAIGWTLWKETGMASSAVHQSFFTGAMANVLTLMPSAQGVALFLAELAAATRTAGVVHIGAVERGSIAAVAPGFFDPAGPEPAAADRPTTPARTANGRPEPASGRPAGNGSFYLDRTVRHGPDEATSTRLIDDRDAFLGGHAVSGVGTLPGCFVAELVSEAASRLRPGLVVVSVRDMVFQSFLRIDGPATRSPLRLHATVRAESATRTVIDVSVTVNLVSPRGVALNRDKPFYTATVVLAPDFDAAPTHTPWPSAPEDPIIDPYLAAASPVYLTGEFVTTADTRLHPLGKLARYRAATPPGPPYSEFLLPVLLMDGLVRLAVLERFDEHLIPVAAPTRIGRVDFFANRNDASLSARPSPAIELYGTPRGLGIGTASAAKFWAVGPDGRYLLQMSGVEGVVLGYIDERTGAGVPATRVPATGLAGRPVVGNRRNGRTETMIAL
nr:SDR family oxidoreductase [Micromonospora sp. DSM 115978]